MSHLDHPALEEVPVVELTEEEYEKVWEDAQKRADFQANIPHDEAYRNVNYKTTGVEHEVKATAAEYAVAKFLGCEAEYIGFSTDPNEYKRPDLLGVVEVRYVTDPSNPLRIKHKDAKAKTINVKVYVEGRQVFILGHRNALQTWDRKATQYSFEVKQYRLDPTDTLVEAVEARLGRSWK